MRFFSVLLLALVSAVAYSQSGSVTDAAKEKLRLQQLLHGPGDELRRARREADPEFPPFPCADFQDCVQMVGELKLEKKMCERKVAVPLLRLETLDNGFPWGHLFSVVGLIVALFIVLKYAVKYSSKSREQKRASSTTTLGGGFFAFVGLRRTSTTERFRDVATETEATVHGHVSAAILPGGGDLVGPMLASAAAATDAPAAGATTTAEILQPDVVIPMVDDEDDLSAPAGTPVPPARFCAVI